MSLLLFLCVGYAAFSTNLSITAKGNIKEKTKVIQAWAQTDQTDFHSDFYRQNIVSATFLTNNDIPSNATESWNVSEDKQNGGVMAWVIPNNNDNTKYDLYIGARGGVIANEDSGWLFAYFTEMREIIFNDNFDTSNVTNMNGMFSNCINLLSLDVSSFNTNNVINMAWMFGGSISAGCMKLETLILGDDFNTSNVTYMHSMFANLGSIKTIDVSMFDTSNVTTMYEMFTQDFSLESIIGLEKFDTSKVEEMQGMFYRGNYTTLNLCSFDTRNVINMQKMFYGISNLQNIYVGPNWSTSQADTTNMFSDSAIASVTTGQC